MPLEPKDRSHLTAAEGYAELGMYLDADAELEEITAEMRHSPEVLAMRIRIYRGLETWELMRMIADKLAAHDLEKMKLAVLLAYATRRAQSIENAKRILLAALER